MADVFGDDTQPVRTDQQIKAHVLGKNIAPSILSLPRLRDTCCVSACSAT
jgi:hypothetical protein